MAGVVADARRETEAIVAQLKRQAANDPQSLGIEASEDLVINGKVDLDDLAMVIAGGP